MPFSCLALRPLNTVLSFFGLPRFGDLEGDRFRDLDTFPFLPFAFLFDDFGLALPVVRERERERDAEETKKETDKQTNKQTNKQTKKKTNKHTNKQTNKQTKKTKRRMF